jgi:hypothetical protein
MIASAFDISVVSIRSRSVAHEYTESGASRTIRTDDTIGKAVANG